VVKSPGARLEQNVRSKIFGFPAMICSTMTKYQLEFAAPGFTKIITDGLAEADG
jgi:hypothetical protein